MTRDYSSFLPPVTPAKPSALQSLGWQPFFAQQTDIDEMAATPPIRVTQVHRNGLICLGDDVETLLPPRQDATVGDWLMFNAEAPNTSRLLDRKSLIKRRAAGHDRSVQLIAANIDTAFVVTSCNADFNVARLERYIALTLEADVTPVILLTKPDLADDPDLYLDDAKAISDLAEAMCVNATDGSAADLLAPWCKPGQTVVFLGSSGVGKSTLTNALAGSEDVATQAIREDDAKGRHTTTHRHLHILTSGCAVLDTPGMRELQLTDAAAGVAEMFSDLDDLATTCKFNDCAHDTEPGCAVRAAIADGTIDAARLERWKKLVAEDAFNSATLAERRAKDKNFGKMIKDVKKRIRK